MKNILGDSHFLFTSENPLYPSKYGQHPDVNAVAQFLNQHGEEAEIVHGKFNGTPENSILVKNPKNVKGLHQLAADLGQEAGIHSVGGKHEYHIYNGDDAGKIVTGQGTQFHKEVPEDNFTTIHTNQGPLHFSHNLDFSSLGKSESLNKMGAVRRLYGNFNAYKELGEEGRKEIQAWTGGSAGDSWGTRDPRAKLPEPSSNARLRMMNKISNRATYRLNPQTKQREYLLHRQMSQDEHDQTINGAFINHPKTHSSWTPHLSSITESSGMYPKTSPNDDTYNNIVSAWIPESHIKSFIPQYGSVASAGIPGPISAALAKEQEVIVRPGHNSKIQAIHKDTKEDPNKWTWQKTLGKSESLTKASNPQVEINPEHGKTIANAYEQMAHLPEHPQVKAAYNALIGETKKQYQDMLKSGIKISKMKPDMENPYKTSKDMHKDIEENNHLWYLPTEQEYGNKEQGADHPMLQPTEFTNEGSPMPANDLFRVVHDYRGHYLGGKSGFGPKGEHQAYLQHKKDYSPLANKALFSETVGQNNTVNFGKNGQHNRANPSKTIYADQKAGLMPDSIINARWHNEP